MARAAAAHGRPGTWCDDHHACVHQSGRFRPRHPHIRGTSQPRLHRMQALPMRKCCTPQPSEQQRSSCERLRLSPDSWYCHVHHASMNAGTTCSCCSAAPCREARTVQHNIVTSDADPAICVRGQSLGVYVGVLPDGRASRVTGWLPGGGLLPDSSEKRFRTLRPVMLCQNANDHRLATHTSHLRPSLGAHGDLHCDHRERGRAVRPDCFATRTASLRSSRRASRASRARQDAAACWHS